MSFIYFRSYCSKAISEGIIDRNKQFWLYVFLLPSTDLEAADRLKQILAHDNFHELNTNVYYKSIGGNTESGLYLRNLKARIPESVSVELLKIRADHRNAGLDHSKNW